VSTTANVVVGYVFILRLNDFADLVPLNMYDLFHRHPQERGVEIDDKIEFYFLNSSFAK